MTKTKLTTMGLFPKKHVDKMLVALEAKDGISVTVDVRAGTAQAFSEEHFEIFAAIEKSDAPGTWLVRTVPNLLSVKADSLVVDGVAVPNHVIQDLSAGGHWRRAKAEQALVSLGVTRSQVYAALKEAN